MINPEITVAEFFRHRLKQIGADHLSAVPGDFVPCFFDQLLKSEVKRAVTCNELNAAYTADGYARLRGIGALSTALGVKELSAIDVVTGNFAEGVPRAVITGSPAAISFSTRSLPHHTPCNYQIPLKMYKKIKAASIRPSCGETALAEIGSVAATRPPAAGLSQPHFGCGGDGM